MKQQTDKFFCRKNTINNFIDVTIYTHNTTGKMRHERKYLQIENVACCVCCLSIIKVSVRTDGLQSRAQFVSRMSQCIY